MDYNNDMIIPMRTNNYLTNYDDHTQKFKTILKNLENPWNLEKVWSHIQQQDLNEVSGATLWSHVTYMWHSISILDSGVEDSVY